VPVPSVIPPRSIYPAVFLISAAVLGLELVLMRCLRIATWSHLSYFVISTALLGFGASGTLLSLGGKQLLARWRTVMWAMLLLFAVAVPCCFQLAQRLPVDIRQLPYELGQVGVLVAVHLLLLVPFFLGAGVVGLGLMVAGERTPAVYGANLLGSGLGAIGAVGVMFVVRPEQALWWVAAVAGIAALIAVPPGRFRLGAIVCTVGVAGLTLWSARPIQLRIDPYKSLAQMQRLVRQADATHLARYDSPRSRIDLFDCPRSHYTLFASPLAPLAPRQLTMVIDGGVDLPLFLINAAEQAGILDYTPMILPYRLVQPARVLLLGENSGTNVWLARRCQAGSITLVNPDPQIGELMRRPPVAGMPALLSNADTTAITDASRAFLERTTQRFDLIQLCDLEAMTAGSQGLSALTENFLVTTEGVARCLDRLTDRGMLCVTRGVQSPPRDNIKLLATMVDALERNGVSQPGQHLIQVRNYLAACTMASRQPLRAEWIDRLRQECDRLGMDVVWYPGIRQEETNRFAVRPGPPDQRYDYLHHAAVQILSNRRDEFYDKWAFNVRPATDDRPYFFDFWKWRCLPLLRSAYGPGWLASTELGYLALVAAAGESVVAAAVLILLPLAWLRSGSTAVSGRVAVLTYFVCLGLAYLLLEMALISWFTRFMGDPVYSAAVVLTGFMVFSGVGSLLSQRSTWPAPRLIASCVLGICVLCVGYLMGLNWLFGLAGGAPSAVRVAICLALLAPLAAAMGVPFPQGLAMLGRRREALVPWAWGINGFASVTGTSLAVLLATSLGFGAVLATAAGLYGAAAMVVRRLAQVTQLSRI